jgi:hypothetical protein
MRLIPVPCKPMSCKWSLSQSLYAPLLSPRLLHATAISFSLIWWPEQYFVRSNAYGWQPYHLHVPHDLKSGSLNLLEPSGPVQTCIGIALPLQIIMILVTLNSPPSRYKHEIRNIHFGSGVQCKENVSDTSLSVQWHTRINLYTCHVTVSHVRLWRFSWQWSYKDRNMKWMNRW